jgi:hypothetical protein
VFTLLDSLNKVAGESGLKLTLFSQSGTPSELGIIPCAIDGIFDAITAVRI